MPSSLVADLDSYNKENQQSCSVNKVAPTKRSSKFSDLLSNAAGDIQKGEDLQVAHSIQRAEFQSISNEWVQEIVDKKVSEKLQADIEREEKANAVLEEKRGEEEAMRVAIEERRRIKALAEEKRKSEAADAEFAKKSILADIDERHRIDELCAKDEDFAKQYAKQIDDEILAERLQEEERKEQEMYRKQQDEIAEADCKFAAETESRLMKEVEDEKESLRKADFEFARKAQQSFNREYHEEKVTSVAKDAEVAKKVSIKMAREDHRNEKKRLVMNMGKNFTDLKVVHQVWEDAEAEVEDVSGGICITILLPFMNSINVKISGRRKNRVELEARRTTFSEESEFNKRDENSNFYAAEFVIDGAENMKDKDVSYDYSSESGLLHIYIDDLMLKNLGDSEEEKKGVLAGLKKSFNRFYNAFRK